MLQDTWVTADPIEWELPPQQPPNTAAQLLFMLILFAVVVMCIVCVLRLRKKPPPPTVHMTEKSRRMDRLGYREPPPIRREPAPRVLIICPYCGAKNEQGMLKCRKCSAEI